VNESKLLEAIQKCNEALVMEPYAWGPDGEGIDDLYKREIEDIKELLEAAMWKTNA
jgi:hypothetical protein